MMPLQTSAFDPDRYFKSEAAQRQLLDEARASGDAAFIADAVAIVARNRGMRDADRRAEFNGQPGPGGRGA